MKNYLFLLLLAYSGFANQCDAQRGAGERGIIYNGNKFRLAPQNTYDTIAIADPISGHETTRVSKDQPFPVSINGQHIYGSNEVDEVASCAPGPPLEERILENMKRAIPSFPLPDGVLLPGLRQVVLDKNGKIVYSDYSGIKYIGKDNKIRALNAPEAGKLFKNIRVRPAIYKGHAVASHQRLYFNNYLIQVKAHQLVYKEK